MRSIAKRPIETAAGAVFTALMTGVLINAIALQSVRHPSPLFSPAPTGVVATAAPVEAPKPLPRPVSVALAPPVSAPPVAVAPHPVAVAHETPDPAEAKAPDAIGQMLRSGASAGVPAPDARRVLAAQKGLVKLGFVLRPDGVIGATTRQAIEKYERERGLPPRGELTPKLMREIAARSGLPSE
ncbi:MAG: hypothetical protein NVSMB26_08350 [Beijerinckiaceae bacterium]